MENLRDCVKTYGVNLKEAKRKTYVNESICRGGPSVQFGKIG